jgi:hypothetical protein
MTKVAEIMQVPPAHVKALVDGPPFVVVRDVGWPRAISIEAEFNRLGARVRRFVSLDDGN